MNINKKFKVLIIIVICSITIWCIMFLTDFIRCYNKYSPIYVVKGELNVNKQYYHGIFYTIEHEFRIGVDGTPITSVISTKMYLFNKQIL